jgi:hypothetical protein
MLVVEHALASGRSMESVTEALTGAAPKEKRRLLRIARRLGAGSLREALAPLRRAGLDPLVAEAATLKPDAIGEVRRGVESTEAAGRISLPLQRVSAYLLLVFSVQLFVMIIAKLFIFTSFRMMLRDIGVGSQFLGLLDALPWVLVLLVAGTALLMSRHGLRVVSPGSWKDLQAAKLHAAAAGLAAAGQPGDAARFLAAHPEAGSPPETAADAAGLGEIALALSFRARMRAERVSRFVFSGGMLIAFLIVILVYRALFATLGGLTS